MSILSESMAPTGRELATVTFTSDNEATEGQRMARLSIHEANGATAAVINVSADELRAAVGPDPLTAKAKAVAHEAANILHSAESGGHNGRPAEVRRILAELIRATEARA